MHLTLTRALLMFQIPSRHFFDDTTSADDFVDQWACERGGADAHADPKPAGAELSACVRGGTKVPADSKPNVAVNECAVEPGRADGMAELAVKAMEMVEVAADIANADTAQSVAHTRADAVEESSADLSFASFVALDFNQQLDLVATHHQADHANEAVQTPSGREREEPATKRHKANLDDSDGDAAIETESEAGFDLSALFNQAAAVPRASQPDTAQDVEVVKRRITGKRAADGTDFPARALISKSEQVRLKSIEHEKQAKVRKLNKAAIAVQGHSPRIPSLAL